MANNPRRLGTAAVAVASLVAWAGVSAAAAEPVASSTATSTAGAVAATSFVQSARLVASTSTIPTSTTHTSSGAVNLAENGTLQRYSAISNSPRPTVRSTGAGSTTLATPNSTTSPSSWLPVVAPTAVSSSRPNAVTGFQGLNEHDNGVYAGFSLEPPDQGLCVGAGHVLELINDVIRVYSTTGTPQSAPVYLNDFFKEPGYQFTTDPSCVFDAGTQRFVATELTLEVDQNTGNLTGKNWLDVAVSKTSNPTGGYNIYRIDVTDDGTNGTPSHTDCPCIGDYPHLATDAYGVYLTTNEYPFSGPGNFGNNFNGAQIYAISKFALANGAASPRVIHFQNVRVPSTSGPVLVGFTLWPAQSAGTAYDRNENGTINFTSSFAAEEARPYDFTGHANQLGLWWISNTASLASASPNLALRMRYFGVGSYGIPPYSNQKAGPVPLKDCLNVNCRNLGADPYAPEQEGPLDSSDTRILTSYYANGQVYTALDTAMIVSQEVQAGFEWFAVNATPTTRTLANQGYVGVARNNVIMPSVATDTTGHGYLGVTLSGNDWYPSAAYGRWNAGSGFGSAVNVAAAGAAPQDGFCEYLYFNCAQTTTGTSEIRPRWGDYGYAAWDGSQFYVANEYIAKSCTFTWFRNDTTCGGSRTFYGNFSTHIQVLSP